MDEDKFAKLEDMDIGDVMKKVHDTAIENTDYSSLLACSAMMTTSHSDWTENTASKNPTGMLVFLRMPQKFLDKIDNVAKKCIQDADSPTSNMADLQSIIFSKLVEEAIVDNIVKLLTKTAEAVE